MRIPLTLRALLAASLVIALVFLATRPRANDPPALRWSEVPQVAQEACEEDHRLRGICPTRIPRTTDPPGWDLGGDEDTSIWGIAASAPYEREPFSRNRPPRFLHLQVYAGDMREDFPAFKAQNHRKVGFRDSLLEDGGEWYSFGTYSWSDRRGELFLGPPSGGMNAGHLVFRWEDDGIGRVVSLHAWAPLTEAREVLGSIVGSIE